jgi:hypothetical protein
MGWDGSPHQKLTNYSAIYDTANYKKPLHYSQDPTMRLPNTMYPDDIIFGNGYDYLHPPPLLSYSSNISIPSLGLHTEL